MTSTKGLKIASVAGVPIYVSWSWWIFAVLIMVVFRPTFAQALPDASTGWTWAVSAFFVLIMFGTVLIHELAHALAARSFGWQVNEITLNFWGGVTVYQHSSKGKSQTPLRSLTVALVGPLSNLAIAAIAWVLLQVLLDPTGTTMVLLSVTVWTNLLIGVFNLLPGHPLDGGRVVESAVWAATGSRARGMRAAGWSGRLIVVVLVLVGFLLPLLLTGDFSLFGLVIVALIGSMLWQSATGAIRAAEMQLLAEQMRITDLMTPVHTIASDAPIATLNTLLPQTRQGHEYQQLPIAVVDRDHHTGHERLVGIVDYGALSAVPPASWNVPVSAVAQRVNPAARIGVEDSVENLFTRFMEFPDGMIGVVETAQSPHRVIGIVNPDALARRLHT